MSPVTANLSAEVAARAAACSFEQLPATAVHAAARAVLDAIGVMAAASGLSDDVQPFVRHALDHGAEGRSTIIGFGKRRSAPMAAFANGAMAHALDYEDVFDAAPCHPNASAVPAGLALVQHLPAVNGKDFLAAITVGCEVACRLSIGTQRALHNAGWYPPPLLAAVGAAVVVAKLLGGESARTIDTLSHLLLQLGAPGDIGRARDTTLRATREAFPARAAVTSGLLAAAGVRGFEDPLGGPAGFLALYTGAATEEQTLLAQWRGTWDDAWGDNWCIEELSFKPWPTCRGAHGGIGIALELARDLRIDWRHIVAIDVGIDPLQRMLAEPIEQKRAPATVIDAKFSLPFSIAVAFVRGRVTLDEFNPAALRDADILALARRVNVHGREPRDTDRAAGATLRVELSSGDVVEREAESALGSPAAPLSDEQLIDKFVDCCQRAARAPSARLVRNTAERLLNLHDEPDVGRLVDELFPS